jgi:branched-chain amino acid aminotransferase
MGEITRYCWHNGHVVEHGSVAPSIASFSFHTGTGVFDGLMAYWNGGHYYVHEAEAHFDRLRAGAAHLAMPVTWSSAQLTEGVHQLLRNEPPRTYYIRPIVFRSKPELWFTAAEKLPVDVSIFGIPVPRGVREPIGCELSPVERVSSRAIPVQWKVCGTYVNSYLARRSATASGFKDGVMLDRQGRIAEASASNVFFIGTNGLVTPPLNEDVFPGITRSLVLKLCRKLAVPCEERDLYPGDLPGMKGAFLCSTLSELKPIAKLGEIDYQSGNDPAFRAIAAAFDELMAQ